MLPIFTLAARRATASTSASTVTRFSSQPVLSAIQSYPSSGPRLLPPALFRPVRSFASASIADSLRFRGGEADDFIPVPMPRARPAAKAVSLAEDDMFEDAPKPVAPSIARTASPTSSPAPSSSSSRPSSLSPDDFPMSPVLRRSLTANFSITSFFPIQAECYRPITEGRDLIGRSKTGTGKTLAFILPILQRLTAEGIRAGRGEMSVLILEPTRELARQVRGEIEKLAPSVRVATVYGGVGYGEQQSALLRGVDICVGTPGRLMDLLDRGACTTRGTRILVLDEADEMLARGFKKDIDTVLQDINKRRKAQTLLFSATLPQWVRDISAEFQRDAIVVDKVTGEDNATPPAIDHVAMAAPRMMVDRIRLIGELARSVEGRAILFVNRKADADLICDFRDELGVRARPLHGDLSQAARDSLMDDFRRGKLKMLVATDIASRGLDIPDVQMIIQDGLPSHAESYVHRTGRTGRAGKKGKAVLLYRERDRQEVGGLLRDLRVPLQFHAPPVMKGLLVSGLTGETGELTFVAKGKAGERLTMDGVLQELERLIDELISPTKVIRVEDGILFDVPEAHAQKLIERLPSKQGGVSVSVATELPASLFGSSGHFVGRHGGRQDPRGRGAASSERRSGPFPFRAGGGASRRNDRGPFASRGSSEERFSNRRTEGGGRYSGEGEGGRGGGRRVVSRGNDAVLRAGGR